MKEENLGFPLQQFYSRIYKTYDLVNRLFTFGLDEKWRSETVKLCLSYNPDHVLDLCCGTGDLALRIGMLKSKTIKVTGYDLNKKMLELARIKADKIKVPQIDFIQGDVAAMPFSNNEFDCITIGFGFRNLTFENPDRDKYLNEINRVLKPGGRLLILESAVPENRFVNFFYKLYLNLFLIPLGGLLSGDFNAYRYLARSSIKFYSLKEIESLFQEFNLEIRLQKKYLFEAVNILVAGKK